MARHLNFKEQPLKLSVGSTIGTFTGVEADQVNYLLLGAESKEVRADITSTGGEGVSTHLQQLYYAAIGSGLEHFRKSAELLTTCKYSTVFSTGYKDVGHTALVERSNLTSTSTTTPNWAGKSSKSQTTSTRFVVENVDSAS